MKQLTVIALAAILVTQSLLVGAAEAVHVTKLRTAKVVLFDAPEGNQIGEVLRDQFTPGSWTVKGDPQRGYVQVVGNGATFWVKNFAIDTNRRIASTAECGVQLAGSERKMGATRGLGEECK